MSLKQKINQTREGEEMYLDRERVFRNIQKFLDQHGGDFDSIDEAMD